MTTASAEEEKMEGMQEGIYTYPPNKRAQGLTVEQQLLKVAEELGEVAKELLKTSHDPELVCCELEDLSWAVEGVKRFYTDATVMAAREATLGKAKRRGDI